MVLACTGILSGGGGETGWVKVVKLLMRDRDNVC